MFTWWIILYDITFIFFEDSVTQQIIIYFDFCEAVSCEVSMLLTNFSLVCLTGTIYSLSSLTGWCLPVYDISPWWSFFSSYSFLMIQFSFDFLQYIGSFSVTGADPNERAENVQKQLEQMRVSMIQTCRTVRILPVLCRD